MRAVEIPTSVLDEPEMAVGFWTRVNRKLGDGSGCWNWIGAKLPNGYGTYTVDGGKTRYAHRIAYTAEVGPIPDGLVIDHACGNRRCVNPAHLRAVTQKQNLEHRIALQPGNKSGYRGVSWSEPPASGGRPWATTMGCITSAGSSVSKTPARRRTKPACASTRTTKGTTLTSIELPLSRALDEVQSVVLDRFRKYGERNISNSPGGPLNGLRVRLHDKLARLNNAVDSGNTDFDDDSFRDCFIDVVGYGLIGLLVVDGNWPGVDGAPAVEKPLADLVDRDQVARVLASANLEAVTPKVYRLHGFTGTWPDPKESDFWAVGTTFRPDDGDWTWHRKADGWVPTRSDGSAVQGEKHPNLRSLVNEFYPGDSGTITEPSTLQKEAA